jgi:hypothetical protein
VAPQAEGVNIIGRWRSVAVIGTKLVAETGTLAGELIYVMVAAYTGLHMTFKVNVFRVECVRDFGAGIYTFLKFLGGCSVLLTQRVRRFFSLLQVCESLV